MNPIYRMQLVVDVLYTFNDGTECSTFKRVVNLAFAPADGTVLRLTSDDGEYTLDFAYDTLVYDVEANEFLGCKEECSPDAMPTDDARAAELERLVEMYRSFGFTLWEEPVEVPVVDVLAYKADYEV